MQERSHRKYAAARWHSLRAASAAWKRSVIELMLPRQQHPSFVFPPPPAPQSSSTSYIGVPRAHAHKLAMLAQCVTPCGGMQPTTLT